MYIYYIYIYQKAQHDGVIGNPALIIQKTCAPYLAKRARCMTVASAVLLCHATIVASSNATGKPMYPIVSTGL